MNLEIPTSFEDVTITFSEEEWKMLSEEEKELYREVMVQNYENMISVGYIIPAGQLLSLLERDEELSTSEVKWDETEQPKDYPEARSRSCIIPGEQIPEIDVDGEVNIISVKVEELDQHSDHLDLSSSIEVNEKELSTPMLNERKLYLMEQENENTARKTKLDLSLLQQFLLQTEESREIHDIPIPELDRHLANFISYLKRKDGSDYEPSTVRGIVRSVERYLQQKKYPCSVFQGTKLDFPETNQALQAKERHLKQMGKGNKPQKAEPLSDEDIARLFESGTMGLEHPTALLNLLFFSTGLHFALKPQEQYDLKWSDISLTTDIEGRTYLQYNKWQCKTKIEDDTQNMRLVQPRLYPNTANLQRDPVAAYLLYKHNRPPQMQKPNSPFYVIPNLRYIIGRCFWFKNMGVGINRLRTMMEQMKIAAGLPQQKRITNYSIRKTTFKKLIENNISLSEIQQITGAQHLHISNYSIMSEQRQREISDILHNFTPLDDQHFYAVKQKYWLGIPNLMSLNGVPPRDVINSNPRDQEAMADKAIDLTWLGSLPRSGVLKAVPIKCEMPAVKASLPASYDDMSPNSTVENGFHTQKVHHNSIPNIIPYIGVEHNNPQKSMPLDCKSQPDMAAVAISLTDESFEKVSKDIPCGHETQINEPLEHTFGGDNHHITAVEELSLDHEMTEKKIHRSEKENKNTARKTKVDVNLLQEFLIQVKETRDIHTIPLPELDQYVSDFIFNLKRKDRSDYEPSTIRGIVGSIERYLQQHKYPHSVLQGGKTDFPKTIHTLRAKQRYLRRMGKGKRPKKADPLTDDDIAKLFQTGTLGQTNPTALVNLLFFSFGLHFALRPQEQYHLKWKDITSAVDTCGRKYLQYNKWQSKTKSTENASSRRQIPARLYADVTNPERDPVTAYLLYKIYRPQQMLASEAPFYLAPYPHYVTGQSLWYKNMGIGINKLKTMMEQMKTAAGLPHHKRITNYSTHKTLKKLIEHNIPPAELQQIVGVPTLQSINNHALLSERKYIGSDELQSSLKIDDEQPCNSKRQHLLITPVISASDEKKPDKVSENILGSHEIQNNKSINFAFSTDMRPSKSENSTPHDHELQPKQAKYSILNGDGEHGGGGEHDGGGAGCMMTSKVTENICCNPAMQSSMAPDLTSFTDVNSVRTPKDSCTEYKMKCITTPSAILHSNVKPGKFSEVSPHDLIMISDVTTNPVLNADMQLKESSEDSACEFECKPDATSDAASCDEAKPDIHPEDHFWDHKGSERKSCNTRQESKNTARRTRLDIKLLQEFLMCLQEFRKIHDIPMPELDEYLSGFIFSLKRKDGSDYEPSTIRGIVGSIERYLQQNSYPHSVLQGAKTDFSKTNQALRAKQRHLRQIGKGKRPKRAEPLTNEDIDQLFQTGTLGQTHPTSLLNFLFFSIGIHFALRPQEQYHLKWYDIILSSDKDDRKYLQYNKWQSNARTGENTQSVRATKRRLYSNTANPERDPVTAYLVYKQNRPPEMLNPDSPFYITPNPHFVPGQSFWYKNTGIGINKLKTMMEQMKTAAGLPHHKRITNYSTRKTVCS